MFFTKVYSQTNQRIQKLSWRQRIVWIFNILLYLYSLIAFLAIHIPPTRFWPVGFITLSIPIILVIHIFLSIYWIWAYSKRAIVSILILIIAYPLFERTFVLHWKETPDSTQNTIKVLSYNTQRLNAHDYYEGDKSKPKKIIEWISQSDADIKCLQEFHDEDGSKTFNAISKIATSGNYNYYITPLAQSDGSKGFDGVAIFTKYPIIHTGDIIFDRRTLNKGIFVDIKVGEDTLRVFSVHLYSMSIRAEKLGINKEYKEVKSGFKDVFARLRRGFITHSRQVTILERYIQESPYPVIVCGDFNAVPYSFAYQKIRKNLANAFEDAGSGFGFSYNDSKLFFLRIDNQFYSNTHLGVSDFQTHREIGFSDHFPISATYKLINPKQKR
ncbi:endonuclease/exonuclease/phosphatase family protein [Cytophagaceae bacterium DM2B3-1]|uniref:Endonuclease/exonuclease/phosphatase family protein n=1 Tax=Xanthocytophaga flava TaxID=3048013 RepID=A0ABT7CRT4_9BACT|nr:endonuclease/exonuclease/phosphatase family protein [Xanthocytophaga flavus]MDJ1495680.1 endonuclease/exonuclease/phosphatase family protein [Xanthocytophaga flavus]